MMILGTSAFVYRAMPEIYEGDADIYKSDEVKEYCSKLILQNIIFISKSIKDNLFENNIFESKENEIQQKVIERFPEASVSVKFSITPIHADVSFVNASDELDIEAFKNWRSEFKDAEFIL